MSFSPLETFQRRRLAFLSLARMRGSWLEKSIIHGQSEQADDDQLDSEPDGHGDQDRYQAGGAAEYGIEILRVVLRLLNAVKKTGNGADAGQNKMDRRRNVS